MPPKTDKEMLSELYDAVVGGPGPGQEGMGPQINRVAEHIEDCQEWQRGHEKTHSYINRAVWGVIITLVTSSLVALLVNQLTSK